MLSFVKALPFVQRRRGRLDNQNERDAFVHAELRRLAAGSELLDAGCGSQRYRPHCAHLRYRAQDFGQYTVDSKPRLDSDGVGGTTGYAYGTLDYVGDIWAIDAPAARFDAVLCTEVFEHIPYPNETIREFARLLRPGGRLILTAPSNCLRHMDPYWFYSGFSDRWFERILPEHGLRIDRIEPVGDYYRWLAVEMKRTAESHSLLAKAMLAPAFLYYYTHHATPASTDTLCMGYHVVATRVPDEAAARH